MAIVRHGVVHPLFLLRKTRITPESRVEESVDELFLYEWRTCSREEFVREIFLWFCSCLHPLLLHSVL